MAVRAWTFARPRGFAGTTASTQLAAAPHLTRSSMHRRRAVRGARRARATSGWAVVGIDGRCGRRRRLRGHALGRRRRVALAAVIPLSSSSEF